MSSHPAWWPRARETLRRSCSAGRVPGPAGRRARRGIGGGAAPGPCRPTGVRGRTTPRTKTSSGSTSSLFARAMYMSRHPPGSCAAPDAHTDDKLARRGLEFVGFDPADPEFDALVDCALAAQEGNHRTLPHDAEPRRDHRVVAPPQPHQGRSDQRLVRAGAVHVRGVCPAWTRRPRAPPGWSPLTRRRRDRRGTRSCPCPRAPAPRPLGRPGVGGRWPWRGGHYGALLRGAVPRDGRPLRCPVRPPRRASPSAEAWSAAW